MNIARQKKARFYASLRYRRRDWMTRMVVDIGIHYAEILGQNGAGDFMRNQAIPTPVIERVLRHPSRRRR